MKGREIEIEIEIITFRKNYCHHDVGKWGSSGSSGGDDEEDHHMRQNMTMGF